MVNVNMQEIKSAEFQEWCQINGFDPQKPFFIKCRVDGATQRLYTCDADSHAEIVYDYSVKSHFTFFDFLEMVSATQPIYPKKDFNPETFNLLDNAPTCWVRDLGCSWRKAKFIQSYYRKDEQLTFIVICDDMVETTKWTECVFTNPIKEELDMKIAELEKNLLGLTNKINALKAERDGIK